MHIAFDMLVVEHEQGEAQQATFILLNELAALSTYRYTIITGRPEIYKVHKQAANIRLYPIKIRTRQGILTQHQLLLPAILRRLQPDILHVPSSITPIGWHGPLVMVVYDLARLSQQFTDSQEHILLYQQYMLYESMKQAKSIIIPSEHLEHLEKIQNAFDVPQALIEKSMYSIESKMQAHVVLHAYHEAISHQ
ncbi:MAG: hypothetical protein H0U76_14745 [Ktedonobacteraceae bacterium]|nr:hypothetical protein [Ktedonobacteraceae bacterium]